MKKNIVTAIMLLFVLTPFLAVPALAAPELGTNYVTELGLEDGGDRDVREVAVDIVKYLMTFLGIIAVVVILLGGFKWMTAGGNEDKVGEAKSLIMAGIIGLIIILAAFAIVTFVIDITSSALNGDVA